MEKMFYGVKLVVKKGTLIDEQADAYIFDNKKEAPYANASAKFYLVSLENYLDDSQIFENIFRRILGIVLYLDKNGGCKTIAIGKFTKNTGQLNSYQVIRAILCGMYGFCQIANKANSPLFIHEKSIRQITLIIPPEDLSAACELVRTQNFTDMYAEKPSMQEILTKEYGYPR